MPNPAEGALKNGQKYRVDVSITNGDTRIIVAEAISGNYTSTTTEYKNSSCASGTNCSISATFKHLSGSLYPDDQVTQFTHIGENPMGSIYQASLTDNTASVTFTPC